jgi:hypothetical protein
LKGVSTPADVYLDEIYAWDDLTWRIAEHVQEHNPEDHDAVAHLNAWQWALDELERKRGDWEVWDQGETLIYRWRPTANVVVPLEGLMAVCLEGRLSPDDAFQLTRRLNTTRLHSELIHQCDETTQAIYAGLLPTWEGTLDELLQTSKDSRQKLV